MFQMSSIRELNEIQDLTPAYLDTWRTYERFEYNFEWFCALVEVENEVWTARDGQAAVFVEAGQRGKEEEPRTKLYGLGLTDWLAFPPS